MVVTRSSDAVSLIAKPTSDQAWQPSTARWNVNAELPVQNLKRFGEGTSTPIARLELNFHRLDTPEDAR